MANSKSLIAETKSAVNKAMYNCTKQKKAIALKFLKELTAEVESLKVVVPKKAKKKAIKKDVMNDKVQWLVNNLHLTVAEATVRVERALAK